VGKDFVAKMAMAMAKGIAALLAIVATFITRQFKVGF